MCNLQSQHSGQGSVEGPSWVCDMIIKLTAIIKNMLSTGHHSDLVSTKPHIIRQRNHEYLAHQKNLMRVISGKGSFADQDAPMIRRTDKYVFFDKLQYSRLP